MMGRTVQTIVAGQHENNKPTTRGINQQTPVVSPAYIGAAPLTNGWRGVGDTVSDITWAAMKKSKMLTGLLCVVVCASMLRGVAAADYVGVAVDDAFVWEMTDGEISVYAKYKVTSLTGVFGSTATYSVYDPDNDELVVLEDQPFLNSIPESTMENLGYIGTVTEENKTYGGEERECYVIAGATGYSGDMTIDAITGVLLEMTFDMVGLTASYKLISWEDLDLEAEYGPSGIPGYGLGIFGICAVIPIVYIGRKYRK